MKIDLDVDISAVTNLTAKVLKKLPYVLNDSITDVAKLAVAAVQDDLRKDFTLRKGNWLTGRFKVLQYSRTSNLTAIIGVDQNVQGSPLLLGFFEEGGEKTASAGPDLAVPLTGEAARPSFSEAIPAAMLYKRLRFQKPTKSRGDLQGLQNTYLVEGVGIFQRIGPGSSELVYSFKPQVELPHKTHMRELAQRVIRESFPRIFTKNFIEEITPG